MSHYCYKNFQVKQNMHGIVGATNEILVGDLSPGRRPANAGLTAQIPPRPEDAE